MVDKKELQKYKLKMLTALGNKIFVPLSFLEDGTLSPVQKNSLLVLGKKIAQDTELKRWNTYFNKSLENLVEEVKKPWTELEDALNDGAFETCLKLYKTVSEQEELTKRQHSYADITARMFLKCKNEKMAELFFDAAGVKTSEDFNKFTEENKYFITSKIQEQDFFKHKEAYAYLFEHMKLNQKEWNNLFCELNYDTSEQANTLLTMELLKDKLNKFDNLVIRDKFLSAYNLNYSYDFNQFGEGLEKLAPYKGKFTLTKSDVYTLVESAIEQSIRLGEFYTSRSAANTRINKIWNALESVLEPIQIKAATEYVNEYYFDSNLYYGLGMVEHISRILPEARVSVDSIDELTTGEQRRFKSMVKEIEAKCPGIFKNLERLGIKVDHTNSTPSLG